MTLSGLIKVNNKRAFWVIFLYLMFAITGTIDLYIYQYAINNLGSGNLSGFIYWQIIELIPTICGLFILPTASYLFNKQIQEYVDELRTRMVKYLYATNHLTTSEMQNHLQNNLDLLTNDYALPWISILSNLFIILLSLGALLSLNWIFVILTAFFIVLDLYLPKVMAEKTAKASMQVSKQNGMFLTVIGEWIAGLNELRRYNSWTVLNKELSRYADKLEESKVNQTKVKMYSNTVNGFGNTFGQMSIAFLAGILFLTGYIKIGAVLASTSFAFSIFSAVSTITSAKVKINSTQSINRQTKQLSKKVYSKHTSNIPISRIEIHDLVLKYKLGKKIEYPDFVINKGEKILLTGDSGTGKSTLFKAILGEIKPYQGEIVFKTETGVVFLPNLSEIGYLAQDSQLFPGTIAENITMFKDQLLEKVPDVLKKMQLEADIAGFPLGINTIVDLNQGNLSGGQLQKIILAREEIFANDIVLIDEATSAIDSNSTEKIMYELTTSSKTIVVIAHNLNAKVSALFDKRISLVDNKEEKDEF
ncbi:ATP-binding cassette domain-containing protein [Lactobacillus xylocopicola]|uniref:ABC transporter ATP-binding protein n=1 Tax=Lactobacillus xylocopicola TaxID=2976676 RepID=A0ABM8BIK3_9LACO|nr:ABC transporter ATP-binding protein [Lactobacillus xylocopicola]BDR61132.1 ABC transporter ATP-binding protein [Lactobacillus xylocopicola]